MDRPMLGELISLYARLYLDRDAPVRLAAMSRAHEVDAVTTLDAGALGRPDNEHLALAVAQG